MSHALATSATPVLLDTSPSTRCRRVSARLRASLCAAPLACPACRRFQRGLKRKALALIKKLRKAKKEASSGEKPDAVSTGRCT